MIDDGDWKRPHPFTLLIELTAAVRDLIIPIVFVLFQLEGLGLEDFAGLLVIVLPGAAAAARYFSTRYALTDDALLHRHGVFRRTSQVLPRRNIQSLSTSAGLIARATGLVELTASDASLGGDIQLRLLSAEEANRIMVLLRADMAARSTVEGGTVEGGETAPAIAGFAPPVGASNPAGESVEAAPIHETSTLDLAKYSALTSLPTALLGLGLIVGSATWFLLDQQGVLPDSSGFRGAAIPVLFSTVFVSVIPLVQPVLTLGGFRLWSEPDRLRIKTGLLTEVQFSARRERVQRVKVEHHLLGRRLNLEQIAFTTADVEGSSAPAAYLAPTVAWGSWPTFAADALGVVELDESHLGRVSPLTFRRQLIRFGVAAGPVVLAGVIAMILVPEVRLVGAAIGIPLVLGYGGFAVWFSRRRANRLGYALGNHQFLARTGVITEELSLVNKDKVQVVGLKQSIFQRRLGLADVRLVTAGIGSNGVTVVPDLPANAARDLVTQLGIHSAATATTAIL